MLHAIQTVAYWLNQIGYIAVFIVLMAESLGIPSPSEIVLLFAGYLVWQGHFSFPVVVVVGAAGSTLGGVGAYYLARYGGRPLLLKRFRFLFKSPEHLEKWERYFRERGDRVIVIGRVLSGVRMVISYPAGLFNMPFGRFLGFSAIGSVLWPLIAVSVGYFLGPRVTAGLAAIRQYEIPAVGAVVVLILAWLWYRRRYRKASRESA